MRKDIYIRELNKNDLVLGLLDNFNRYQKIEKVWKQHGEKRVLVKKSIVEDWDNELKKEIVTLDLTRALNDSGVIFGAFNEANLIAFATILNNFFGSSKQYLQLGQLHISKEFRRRGLGKELFFRCANKAKLLGATKLYISSSSAEETKLFYDSLGCVDAMEVNEEVASHEPGDIQLEFLL